MGGNAWISDRLCGYSGSFSGTITADGTVRIRLDPLFNQGCSRIAGDSTFAGATQPDGAIFIQTSAAATCVDYYNRQQDGTRTVTFPLRRFPRVEALTETATTALPQVAGDGTRPGAMHASR